MEELAEVSIKHGRAGKVALTAMYGSKSASAVGYISSILQILRMELGSAFRPYRMEQVHATIIGLDGQKDPISGEVINKNLAELVGLKRTMDIDRIADLISSSLKEPIAVQFGGYKPTTQYGFTSRGMHPYDRSFSIQGTAAVIVGWPTGYDIDDGHLAIDELRWSFLEANALHRYHTDPSAVDNDLYLVLGHIDRNAVSSNCISSTAKLAREHALLNSVHLDLTPADLFVVSYAETTLPQDTSVAYRVPLSADQLAALY